MISVTDLAAEKIIKAQEGKEMDGKMLRIGVFSGGCSGGYQYALGFDSKSDKDSMFESNGLEVIVKSEDVEKVNGTEIDYVCLLYTSPSPRDRQKSRMPSSA